MEGRQKLKVAFLFPYAPNYREPIYRLIDDAYDVDWFFCGNSERNLVFMDYSVLRNVNLFLKECRVFNVFSYYRGLSYIDFRKYDALIIAGVYQNISEWLIALFYGRAHKKPKLYFWTHGYYGKESRMRKAIKRFFYHCGQGVFLYGERARNLMEADGFDGDSLFVIHNSLDYDKQLKLRDSLVPSDIYVEHFGNTYPVLIFVGRLTSVKELDMIVRSLFDLESRGELYNLVFVGDGSDRIKLEEMTSELQLSNRVWFVGECYDDNINAELLYNADLCVAPGNVGLTAIHSLMFGCPVVSHDNLSWQMPEFEVITPQKTGDFFSYHNQDSLNNTISNWFLNNMTRRESVRLDCFSVIDKSWNPNYQMQIINNALTK